MRETLTPSAASARKRLPALLGLCLAALGVRTAGAQQPVRPFRVAYMMATSYSTAGTPELYEAFKATLRGLGYTEGRNLVIEARWAGGDLERAVSLANELAAWSPDVFVAVSTPIALAAKRAVAPSVPVVMLVVSDPVGSGLVASLARPGANVTGITDFGLDTAGKTLDLARAAVPGLRRIAVMVSGNPVHAAQFEAIRTAADSVGVKAIAVSVRSLEELEKAFATMDAEGAKAVVALGGPPQSTMREKMAELGIRHRVVTIALVRPYAEAGGLLSYGPSLLTQYKLAATYVDKILRGAKPADLPVQQPTELELVINLRTAKALKITIPQSLLLQAVEVIQ